MMVSRTVFTQEMRKLEDEMILMGNLAENMVRTGIKSFIEGKPEYLEELRKLDNELHNLDQTIERHCLDIIALHQPLAIDLRTVSSILKIITDLNRIGRYGRDIATAETSELMNVSKEVPQAMITMTEEVLALVSDAIISFTARDINLARSISQRDDKIDELWKQTLKESLEYMKKNQESKTNVSIGAEVILASRYLERIADHACNIGDRVVFMISGQRPNYTV